MTLAVSHWLRQIYMTLDRSKQAVVQIAAIGSPTCLQVVIDVAVRPLIFGTGWILLAGVNNVDVPAFA